MSYLVLARKYRPQSFEDLVGQDHVARTLANAIASGRVAHAFLFTGVRGVGKTTSARLLAKALNCMGADGQAKGPTATPCQVCAACKEIAGGSDMDVQEIDGASYNGVDEVRRLQEGIAFRPARDRFKVYIVDEVHMLSNAAWNAFLKTLEEPPPHVKFIFATTEVHKVPVTILSRCQRYDFKLIGAQAIARRLREVLDVEKISAEDAAIATLAREAAGSMRDAMSLLDQVIAFSGERLTGEDVARVLGVADRQVLHELAAALVDGNAKSALEVIDRVAGQGFDLAHVARDILRHLRNLVVAKVCGEEGRGLLDLADEEVRDVVALSARAEPDDLLRLYQGFSRSFDEIVRSTQPRTSLEMTLVRLARRPPLLPLDELLARLGELEKRLGGATPPRGAGPGGGGRPPGHAPGAAAAVPSSPAWSEPGGEQRTRGSLALAEPVRAQAGPRSAPSARPQPDPLRPAPHDPSASPATAPTAPQPAADLEAWRAIVARVYQARPPLAAVYEHAIPIEVSHERVLLGYEADSLLATQAADAEALELLQREVRAHFHARTQVALDLRARQAPGRSLATLDVEQRRADAAEARDAVRKHPLVQQAIRIFAAELRDVRLPGEMD